MRPEKELNIIRGKMMINAATQYETDKILEYINTLEALVEEASDADFYGTEGWRHRIGWGE